jgi:hypothetical protein
MVGRQGGNGPFRAYAPVKDNTTYNMPPGWLDALDQAEVEIEAGLFISSEEVHRMLRESIAELEAKAAERHTGKPASSRL